MTKRNFSDTDIGSVSLQICYLIYRGKRSLLVRSKKSESVTLFSQKRLNRFRCGFFFNNSRLSQNSNKSNQFHGINLQIRKLLDFGFVLPYRVSQTLPSCSSCPVSMSKIHGVEWLIFALSITHWQMAYPIFLECARHVEEKPWTALKMIDQSYQSKDRASKNKFYIKFRNPKSA